jgi:sigma-B regulation protein RsbU (phosphoserine phosphatase)
MEKHNSMYFTMWYGVFNKTTRELSYASAGHPPAILVTGPDVASAQPKALSTGGLVVGAMPHAEYQNAKCPLDTFSSLIVFSDGTYEVTQKASGTLWSMQEWNALLVRHVRSPEIGGLASVRQQVIDIQGSDQFEDDFSLLKIVF